MRHFRNLKLTNVSALSDNKITNNTEAATEDLNNIDNSENMYVPPSEVTVAIESIYNKAIPIDKNPISEKEQNAPPNIYYSVNENEKSRDIVLYLDSNVRYKIPHIMEMLNQLSENDTICLHVSEMCLPMTVAYGLLSSIKACKAKTIGHLTTSYYPTTTMIWLACDESTCSTVSRLDVRSGESVAFGNINDIKTKQNLIQEDNEIFMNMLKEHNLLNDEEIDLVFKKNRVLSLVGDEILDKLA